MSAVYIALNAVPHAFYGVVIGEPISYVVFVHIKRVALGVETKEGERANVNLPYPSLCAWTIRPSGIVVRLPPATDEDGLGSRCRSEGRISVGGPGCFGDSASSKRYQGDERGGRSRRQYLLDPGTFDRRDETSLVFIYPRVLETGA